MSKKRVLTNAAVSVLQVFLATLLLFLLYRFLLRSLGLEKMGIWSLVLASASVTNCASFGLSGSVVKFVAQYVARQEKETATEVIETAAAALCLFVGFILCLGYPVLRHVLTWTIPSHAVPWAVQILPHALVSLWLMTMAGVYQSGLDGLQRIDVRQLIAILGTVLYFLLCYFLTKPYGLLGLAYAQILHHAIILVACFAAARHFLPTLRYLPRHWNHRLFKEIIGYGINFQIVSVVQFFYEPVTKIFLGRFGGLALIGFYEIASRIIQQTRGFLVASYQALVPFIAGLHETAPGAVGRIYLTAYNSLFFLLLCLGGLMVGVTPLLSGLFFGSFVPVFVFFCLVLAFGSFMNLLSVPSYFANLGTGQLRWNVWGHLAIGICNLAFGYLLGHFFRGDGVVLAWVMSLSIGSSLIYISYHLENKISLSSLFPASCRRIALFLAFLACATFLIQASNPARTLLNPCGWIAVTVQLLLTIFIARRHPLGRQLLSWLKIVFSRKSVELNNGQ